MSVPEVIGRYRLGPRLGSGGFAVVWLAHDESLDTDIAIKVMADNWADRMDLRERFLMEARMLRRAASNRIVQVFDIGELPDGRPYFVMEYADRGTLADRVRTEPLPLVEALRVTAEVARGASELHRAGIVHRDLKPSNVLIKATQGGPERLLIADLGVAKNLAQASGLTMSVGSAGYMAPEQSGPNSGVDVRADVYSLAAIAYRLITGEVPGLPGFVQWEVPVPLPVRKVLQRALEVEPGRRWPDAVTFAVQLDQLADRFAAEQQEPQQRGSGRRTRTVVTAVAVLAAVAVVAGVGLKIMQSQKPVQSHTVTAAGNAAPAIPAGAPGSPTTTAQIPSTAGTEAVQATPTPGGTAPAAVPTTTPSKGCPPGGADIPPKAHGARTADLDGDEKLDILWLAIKGNTRMLGVQTATGARFATSFTNPAPTTAKAVAGRLGDGSAIILLDFIREVKLYAVVGCAIVPVRNIDGKQYTFDGGFAGFGTGVGCPVIGSTGRKLAGFLAKSAKSGDDGDGVIVTRTTINLSEGGTRALNGAVKTVTGRAESDPTVKRARAVTCGTGGRALEPPS